MKRPLDVGFSSRYCIFLIDCFFSLVTILVRLLVWAYKPQTRLHLGERSMTNTSRRRPREQMVSSSGRPKQQTMDDYHFSPSSTLLTQKFALNSYHRRVVRKGLGRSPKSVFVASDTLCKLSGRKCNNLDLGVLSQSFTSYRRAVNVILEKVFSELSYVESLGNEL